MSDDDKWSDVIHQVLDALDEANVSDPHTRDALADGVRQALDSFGNGMGLNIEITGQDGVFNHQSSASVEVVDGGRDADQPPTEGEKPSLRIAEPNTDEESEDGSFEESSPYVTQVKVVQGSPFQAATGLSMMSDHGWISLPNSGEPEAKWQTIYTGLRPRLYRIACMPGARIDVTVDGVPVERLHPGQSIDVEGSAIRVTSPDDNIATGSYFPIEAAGNEE